MNDRKKVEIHEGGTNVYLDLGYPDAAEMQRKSLLAAACILRNAGRFPVRRDVH